MTDTIFYLGIVILVFAVMGWFAWSKLEATKVKRILKKQTRQKTLYETGNKLGNTVEMTDDEWKKSLGRSPPPGSS